MRQEMDLLGGDLEFRLGVRDFARKLKLDEIAKEADKTGVMPDHVIAAAKDAGFFGILAPEEYGGVGGSISQYCIMIDELARSFVSICNVLAVHNGLAQTPIILFGTEDQKKRYLPKMSTGEMIGAFGVTEPDAGVNIHATRTRAQRKGDKYILNGSKMFITNGPIADVVVALAKPIDEDGEKLAKGLSLFIIDTDQEGFTVGQKINKMGLHCVPTSELVFEDIVIPAENLIGAHGCGMIYAFAALEKGRLAISAGCTGIAARALDIASHYSLERKSGGKSIARHQVIQDKIGQMSCNVWSMATMTYTTAGIMDKERKLGPLSDLTKVFCSETVLEVINEAIQVLGGYGYTSDFPLERMYRDIRVAAIYEGTNEVLRLLAAKQILEDAHLR